MESRLSGCEFRSPWNDCGTFAVHSRPISPNSWSSSRCFLPNTGNFAFTNALWPNQSVKSLKVKNHFLQTRIFFFLRGNNFPHFLKLIYLVWVVSAETTDYLGAEMVSILLCTLDFSDLSRRHFALTYYSTGCCAYLLAMTCAIC